MLFFYSSCITFFLYIISTVFPSKRSNVLTVAWLWPQIWKSPPLKLNVRGGSKDGQLHIVKDRYKQLTFSSLWLENQTGEFTQSVLYQDRTANDLRTKPLTSLGWWQQLCAEGRLNTSGLQEHRRGSLLPRQQEVVDCPAALRQAL